MRRSTLAFCSPIYWHRRRPGIILSLAIVQAACLVAATDLAAQNEPAPADGKAAAAAEAPDEKPAADAPAETPAASADVASGDVPADKPASAAEKALESKFKPLFKIDKELIDEQTVKDFRKKEFDYGKALDNGELSSAARDLIAEGIRVRVLSLSLKSTLADKDLPGKIAEIIRRDLLRAGSANAANARPFREFVLQELIKNCTKLFDNHFLARLQAVVLIANANLVEPNPATPGVPGQAYAPIYEPLRTIIDDPEQPYHLKLPAVVGWLNINQRGSSTPSPNQRIKMGESLIRELSQLDTHDWYQIRILETLSSIEQVLDLNGTTFIATAIDNAVKDPRRKWPVRCFAARSIGRMQITPEMRVDLFVIDILNLARDAADAVNNDPNKSPLWAGCFIDIYCAFMPWDLAESARGVGLVKRLSQPRMDKFEKIINGGYKQLLPLVNHIASANIVTDFPDEMMQPFREWLQTNTPADYQPKLEGADGTKQAQRSSDAPAAAKNP